MIRARWVAALRTKTKGLPSVSTSSAVPTIERRSCGLGRAGTITRSLSSMAWLTREEIAGGVSITAISTPRSRTRAKSSASVGTLVWTYKGVSALRAFHQSARLPCGSMSTSATKPAPLRSASTARWPASVVLPDPPFREATVNTSKGNPSFLCNYRRNPPYIVFRWSCNHNICTIIRFPIARSGIDAQPCLARCGKCCPIGLRHVTI